LQEGSSMSAVDDTVIAGNIQFRICRSHQTFHQMCGCDLRTGCCLIAALLSRWQIASKRIAAKHPQI